MKISPYYFLPYLKRFLKKYTEILLYMKSKVARSSALCGSSFFKIKSVLKVENILKIMKFISACDPFGISKKFLQSPSLFFTLSSFEI